MKSLTKEKIEEIKGEMIEIFQVVKKMLKNKMKDEDIMENMGISKKELENLKLQMA